jgi:hypothetical protein
MILLVMYGRESRDALEGMALKREDPTLVGNCSHIFRRRGNHWRNGSQSLMLVLWIWR